MSDKDLKYCRYGDCLVIPKMEDEDYPFCSPEHHKLWADENYTRPTNEYGKSKLSIQEMQEIWRQKGEKPMTPRQMREQMEGGAENV